MFIYRSSKYNYGLKVYQAYFMAARSRPNRVDILIKDHYIKKIANRTKKKHVLNTGKNRYVRIATYNGRPGFSRGRRLCLRPREKRCLAVGKMGGGRCVTMCDLQTGVDPVTAPPALWLLPDANTIQRHTPGT